jgi:hypothetical protein
MATSASSKSTVLLVGAVVAVGAAALLLRKKSHSKPSDTKDLKGTLASNHNVVDDRELPTPSVDTKLAEPQPTVAVTPTSGASSSSIVPKEETSTPSALTPSKNQRSHNTQNSETGNKTPPVSSPNKKSAPSDTNGVVSVSVCDGNEQNEPPSNNVMNTPKKNISTSGNEASSPSDSNNKRRRNRNKKKTNSNSVSGEGSGYASANVTPSKETVAAETTPVVESLNNDTTPDVASILKTKGKNSNLQHKKANHHHRQPGAAATAAVRELLQFKKKNNGKSRKKKNNPNTAAASTMPSNG